ncbi:hypothetical protein NBC122_00779 [Chryseobacterium salivictor]|uniref:Uncharacterized protein n=1 Tax=Chryseobacterium salivictor TaxID=2547600 RepID=A0A4V1AKV8_9FLAO|nr:hypothetical protein NBC122_00779 [Chryseobacterium salivictor]
MSFGNIVMVRSEIEEAQSRRLCAAGVYWLEEMFLGWRCCRCGIQLKPEIRRDWMVQSFRKSTETHGTNKNCQFLKYRNNAEEIYTLSFLWDQLNYIPRNPIEAGLVEKAPHYIYS